MRSEILENYKEWKIPSLKISKFDCSWREKNFGPFPFFLRKTSFENGLLIEAIIFNNSDTISIHQSIWIYLLDIKLKSFRYPYSDWHITTSESNEINIQKDKILNALDEGFEWIHIDETGAEWFMDVRGDTTQPCWLELYYDILDELEERKELSRLLGYAIEEKNKNEQIGQNYLGMFQKKGKNYLKGKIGVLKEDSFCNELRGRTVYIDIEPLKTEKGFAVRVIDIESKEMGVTYLNDFDTTIPFRQASFIDKMKIKLKILIE